MVTPRRVISAIENKASEFFELNVLQATWSTWRDRLKECRRERVKILIADRFSRLKLKQKFFAAWKFYAIQYRSV